MKFLVPVAAALALAGCAFFQAPEAQAPGNTGAETGYTHIDIAGQRASPEERAACEAAGGRISREGMLGWEHCVQTYPDAGDACSGSDDCLGTCRHSGEQLELGTAAQGTCQIEDVPFGCYAEIEGGKVQPALCVD